MGPTECMIFKAAFTAGVSVKGGLISLPAPRCKSPALFCDLYCYIFSKWGVREARYETFGCRGRHDAK